MFHLLSLVSVKVNHASGQERDAEIERLNAGRAQGTNATSPPVASLTPEPRDQLVRLEGEKKGLLETVDSLKGSLSNAVESLAQVSAQLAAKSSALEASNNQVKSLTIEKRAAIARAAELEV